MESKWNPSPSRHKKSSGRRGQLRLTPAKGLRLTPADRLRPIPISGRGLLSGAHRLKGLCSLSELRSFGGLRRSSGSIRFGWLERSGELGTFGVRRRRGNHCPCRVGSQERKGME